MATSKKAPKKKTEPTGRLIFALDPSLSASGWALVKVGDGSIQLIDCGEIKTNPKQSHGERLRVIRETLKTKIDGVQITDVVKERGFSRFPKETQALFKTHGIVEELFAEYGVEEYAVTTIKKEVGGHGKATKEEVAKGVKEILGLSDDYSFISDNASDAVAVAITHILKMKYYKRG